MDPRSRSRLAVFVLTVLPAAAALAAPEALCREYAEVAVRQYEEAAALQVPNLGPPLWSTDMAAHKAWCLVVDPAVVAGERQKREQVLAAHRGATGTIVGMTTIDDECTRYAKQAVEHARLNVEKGCGFTGPRWGADQTVHEAWCRQQPSIDGAMAEHKTRVEQLTFCQNPTAILQEGTLQATAMGNLLRVPGLVIGLRHVYCKNKNTVYGGEVPRGNHEVGPNSLPDPTAYPSPVLEYRCGGDEGAPESVGFAWNTFPANAGLGRETLGLPAGVVLSLRHNRVGDQPAHGGGGIGRGPRELDPFRGGDLGSGDFGRHSIAWYGYHWFETTGYGFNGDWSIVDRLPKYTVIGLKHSVNQEAKRLFWLAPDRTSMVTYDPSCEECPPPPGFRRVHGGDRGAEAGEGYDWYEKITGPEPTAIR